MNRLIIILALVMLSSCSTTKRAQKTEQKQVQKVSIDRDLKKDSINKDSVNAVSIDSIHTAINIAENEDIFDYDIATGKVIRHTTRHRVTEAGQVKHSKTAITDKSQIKVNTVSKTKVKAKEDNKVKEQTKGNAVERFFKSGLMWLIFVLLIFGAYEIYKNK
jgi:uncharacterized membrane protein